MSPNHFAWLDWGDTRYFATLPVESPVIFADSAIVRLIQGIGEEYPEQARGILRGRIFSTESILTEMDWGMIKVAAKRVSLAGVFADLNTEPHDLSDRRWVAFSARPRHAVRIHDDATSRIRFESDSDAMKYAQVLANTVQTSDVRYRSARSIAAILVSHQGELLAEAVNTSGLNRTLHAEVNLVQGYCAITQQRLPRGARIYTTLKSCKMCAGMIWTAAEDPMDLSVYFHQDDPGPHAQRTVFTCQSFERLRACSQWGGSASLEVEFQV